jgi:small subunit ribosomal protein S21
MKKNNKSFFNGPPPKIEPLQVVVERNDVDEAHRRFKTMVQRENIISDFKERRFYEKPSERRRRKRREARARKLAMEARQKLISSGEWDKRMRKKLEKKNNRRQNNDS